MIPKVRYCNLNKVLSDAMFLSLIKWNEKWGIHVQWYSIHDVESVKWNPSNDTFDERRLDAA